MRWMRTVSWDCGDGAGPDSLELPLLNGLIGTKEDPIISLASTDYLVVYLGLSRDVFCVAGS